MDKKRQYFSKSIILGILLGILIFLKPIFLLLFFILGCMAIFLRRCDPDDRIVLKRILIIGLVLRLLFTFISMFYIKSILYFEHPEDAIFTKIVGHTPQLFRDFHREILNGINLSRYFKGEYGNLPLRQIANRVAYEGRSNFLHLGVHIQGVLNFIFGISIFNILVYPIFGILLIILVYNLTKEIFDRNVAILASFISAIAPSSIVWSCINIRISTGIICILSIAWSLVKFRKNNHIKYLITFFIALWLFGFTKDKFTGGLLLISTILLFLSIKINPKVKAIAIILAILIGSIFLIKNNFKFRGESLIPRVITNQRAFALYPEGNNYRIYDDFVYSEDLQTSKRISIFTLVKALPKGMAYFLFAPFPWRINNTLRLYSYPQIIFWYFIFLFSIWGIFIGLRYNSKDTLSLLLISLFWIMLLSLVMGNEGIAARHRDLISHFFYIFGSVGIMHFLGKRVFL